MKATNNTFLLIFICVAVTFSLSVNGCEGPAGPEGPEGSPGAIGPAGENGSMMYAGSGEPSNNIGAIGDYFLNTTTGELYGPKDEQGWGEPIIVLMGEVGADGNQIFAGDGPPDASLGADGDYYLDKTSFDLYGPKTSDEWGMPLNLKGDEGEPGPGARIINFTFTDAQIDEAMLEVGGNLASPASDTAAFGWAISFDTTFNQIALTDTEVVFIYADIPGLGFSQLPLNIDFSGDVQITQFSNQVSNFSYTNQTFFIDSFNYNLPAASFGDTTKSVYGGFNGSISSPTSVVTFSTTENEEHLNVRVIIGSGVGLNPNTQYAQVLTDNNSRFPLDSDISNSERDDFITTDSNGEFIYEISSEQLSSLKDTLGSDLDEMFQNNLWALFTVDTDSLIGGGLLRRNPISRNVQLYSQWNADSIRVIGYMEGINYGNDPTAYMNNFPLDIRIIIVSGNDISKRRDRIPYEELIQLIQQ